MTPEERQLLTGLFDRLRRNDHGDRDPEAQSLIETAVAAHPAAPYLMAQLLLIQDQALSAAQNRIRVLQQALETARNSSLAPSENSSFLGGPQRRGPWSESLAAATAAPLPPSTLQTAAASTGGGFLRNALQTATGVAGGALLFEGISSLLHWGGTPGSAPGRFLDTNYRPPFIEQTVLNEGGDNEPFRTDLTGGATALATNGAQPAGAEADLSPSDVSQADGSATDDPGWGNETDPDTI